MKVLTEHGVAKIAITYVSVTDEELERISSDPNFIYDADFVKEISKDKGDNIHVFGINGNTEKNFILNTIQTYLSVYNTVSWWNIERQRFYIRR